MENNDRTDNVLHFKRGAALCKRRGDASLSAGRPEEALALYRRAFALAPDEAVHGVDVADALIELRYRDEAARFILRLLPRSKDREQLYTRLLTLMDERNVVRMTLRMLERYSPGLYYGRPGPGEERDGAASVGNYGRHLAYIEREARLERMTERCERALNSGHVAVAGAMVRRLLRRGDTKRRGRALQARLMAQSTGNHVDALLDTVDVTAMQSPDPLILRCAAAIVCDSERDGADTGRAPDMLIMALEACRSREDANALMEYLAGRPAMASVLLTVCQGVSASDARDVETEIVAEYAALRCGETRIDDARASLARLTRMFPNDALLRGYALYFDGGFATMPHPKELAWGFARELQYVRDANLCDADPGDVADVVCRCGFILSTRYSCARDEALAVNILARMDDPVAGGILADFVAGNTGDDRIKVIALNVLRAVNYSPMPAYARMGGRERLVREGMSRAELRMLIKEHGPRVAMRRLCGRPDEDLSELTAAYLRGAAGLTRWRRRPGLLGAALAAAYLETRGEVNVCERYSRKYDMPRRELRMCMNDISRACLGARGGYKRRKLF